MSTLKAIAGGVVMVVIGILLIVIVTLVSLYVRKAGTEELL